jgi:hypothetical protein
MADIKSTTRKLTVGQRLWYVPSLHGRPHDVEVTKLGRKWAQISGHPSLRINMETLAVEQPEWGRTGTCWLAREELEHKARSTPRRPSPAAGSISTLG